MQTGKKNPRKRTVLTVRQDSESTEIPDKKGDGFIYFEESWNTDKKRVEKTVKKTDKI